MQILPQVVLLAVGTLMGYFASDAMWRRQVREERRKKRADYIVRALQLALASLTHGRCLLYSKTQGIKGVLSLPENPVDELMAIAMLHLPEIAPLVQQLHDKQQDLFAHGIQGEAAAASMLRIAEEMPPIVNQLIKTLSALSKTQKA